MKCELNAQKNVFSNSFFVRTYMLWNRLPLSLRVFTCSSQFKEPLIEHLWLWALEDLEIQPDLMISLKYDHRRRARRPSAVTRIVLTLSQFSPPHVRARSPLFAHFPLGVSPPYCQIRGTGWDVPLKYNILRKLGFMGRDKMILFSKIIHQFSKFLPYQICPLFQKYCNYLLMC